MRWSLAVAVLHSGLVTEAPGVGRARSEPRNSGASRERGVEGGEVAGEERSQEEDSGLMGDRSPAARGEGAGPSPPLPPPAHPLRRSATRGQDAAESKAGGYPTHRPSGKTVLRQTSGGGRLEVTRAQKPGPRELLQEDRRRSLPGGQSQQQCVPSNVLQWSSSRQLVIPAQAFRNLLSRRMVSVQREAKREQQGLDSQLPNKVGAQRSPRQVEKSYTERRGKARVGPNTATSSTEADGGGALCLALL